MAVVHDRKKKEESLPTWERGLKHSSFSKNARTIEVAPHVGAWIETMYLVRDPRDGRVSLPTWERGLKLQLASARKLHRLSLPTWERGLKLWLYKSDNCP